MPCEELAGRFFPFEKPDVEPPEEGDDAPGCGIDLEAHGSEAEALQLRKRRDLFAWRGDRARSHGVFPAAPAADVSRKASNPKWTGARWVLLGTPLLLVRHHAVAV